MMRILLSAAAACALLSSAHAAQLPYPTVSGLIDSQLPTNQSGAISAAALRGVLHNMTDSVPLLGALYPSTSTASTYTYQPIDQSSSITFTAATPVITLQKPGTPAAPDIPIAKGWWAIVTAGASSTVSLTPTGSTINGTSSLALNAGLSAIISTDGVNYFATALSSTGGGGGSGTVNAGAKGLFSYYQTAGTAVSGLPASSALLGLNSNNIVMLGADPTGAVDSTAAFNSAISNVGSTAGSIEIPCGTYKLTPGIALTLAANQTVSIIGGGRECTILDFGSPSGASTALTVNYSAFTSGLNLSGLTCQVDNAPSSQTCLLLNGTGLANSGPAFSAVTTIENVAFRGDDWTSNNHSGLNQAHGWFRGVFDDVVSNVNFIDDDWFSPVGATSSLATDLQGQLNPACAGGTCVAVVINYTNCVFWGGAVGILYGNQVQGVTVTGTNFDNSSPSFGILLQSSQTGDSQLSVSNSQFGQESIQANSSLNYALFTGNFFIPGNAQNSIVGIFGNSSFVGNGFQNSSTGAGINLGVGSINDVITGNTFNGGSFGIVLGSSTVDNNVQSNMYTFVTNKVVNNGGTACPPSPSGNCVGTQATP